MWTVVLSLALAMFLTILPMPAVVEDFRPQWVALTIIFWCSDPAGTDGRVLGLRHGSDA